MRHTGSEGVLWFAQGHCCWKGRTRVLGFSLSPESSLWRGRWFRGPAFRTHFGPPAPPLRSGQCLGRPALASAARAPAPCGEPSWGAPSPAPSPPADDPMNCSSQASLSITNCQSLPKPMSIESLMHPHHPARLSAQGGLGASISHSVMSDSLQTHGL